MTTAGAYLIQRIVMKEMTRSNRWKAGIRQKEIRLESQWKPVATRVIKLIKFTSQGSQGDYAPSD